MKRREFVTLICGAIAWPLAARVQQSGTPVIGLTDEEAPEHRAGGVHLFLPACAHGCLAQALHQDRARQDSLAGQ
jgi:hypothetical protein